MTQKTKPLNEHLEAIYDAILQSKGDETFARNPIEEGDVALVIRRGGGIQMLSTLPDNPNHDVLVEYGQRATFLAGLFKLLHAKEVMVPAMEEAVDDFQGAGGIKLDS